MHCAVYVVASPSHAEHLQDQERDQEPQWDAQQDTKREQDPDAHPHPNEVQGPQAVDAPKQRVFNAFSSSPNPRPRLLLLLLLLPLLLLLFPFCSPTIFLLSALLLFI